MFQSGPIGAKEDTSSRTDGFERDVRRSVWAECQAFLHNQRVRRSESIGPVAIRHSHSGRLRERGGHWDQLAELGIC